MTNENKGKRIMYYYQTLTDLSSVLIKNTPVTHIILSSYHFGTNPNKTPYIHLNNKPPYDPSFNHVWDQLETAKQKYGISIHIMLGGAGGAFTDLFNDFETYYPMLIQTILASPIISGINLDVEEEVTLQNIKMLIFCLRRDLGYDFVISMAPIQSSLQSDSPGMGGFSYKDLYLSEEGQEIEFFNGQFYFDLSMKAFEQCVKNKYPDSQIVLGMIADQDFDTAKEVVTQISTKYPNFGGVFMWEFFMAPPDTMKNPGKWAFEMKQIIDTAIKNKENKDNKKNMMWYEYIKSFFVKS